MFYSRPYNCTRHVMITLLAVSTLVHWWLYADMTCPCLHNGVMWVICMRTTVKHHQHKLKSVLHSTYTYMLYDTFSIQGFALGDTPRNRPKETQSQCCETVRNKWRSDRDTWPNKSHSSRSRPVISVSPRAREMETCSSVLFFQTELLFKWSNSQNKFMLDKKWLLTNMTGLSFLPCGCTPVCLNSHTC